MFKSLKKDILIFLIIFIIQSCVSIFFLQCPDWDFYNYHYYIGYAFLNDRLGTDFLAANFRTCINPYADAITYFLIKSLNNHPYCFLIIHSLDSTVLVYLVYKITDFLIAPADKILKYLSVLLCVGYILFSPILIDGYNYSMNDVFVSDFILISFYLFIKNIFDKSPNRMNFIFLSAVILGLGLTLKHSLYFITIFILLLFFKKQIPDFWKTICVFSITVALSYFLFAGYWLYLVNEYYHSPFFPYMNTIFKSDYFDLMDMSKYDWMNISPRNLFELIFYPFLRMGNSFVGSFRGDWDPRYAMNIIFIIFIAINLFYSRKNNSELYLGIIKRNQIAFLISFVFVSYYFYTSLTGIYRFLIPTSSLFGIVCCIFAVLCCNTLKLNKWYYYIALFLILLFFAYYNSIIMTKHYFVMPKKNEKLFYNDQDFGIKDNSYVIMLNNATSYLIPGQNKNAHYYGFVIPKSIFEQNFQFIKDEDPMNYNNHYMYSNYLENLLLNIISNEKNTIYLIYAESLYYDDIFKKSLDYYSKGKRKIENCRQVGYKGILYFNNERSYFCELNSK